MRTDILRKPAGFLDGQPVQHPDMHGDMPELHENQLEPRKGAFRRIFTELIVRQICKIIRGFLPDGFQQLQQLLIAPFMRDRLERIIRAFLKSGAFGIDIGIEEPFIRRMKCMIYPSPTRRSAAKSISVISPDRGSDIKKIRFYQVLTAFDVLSL